MRARDTPCPSDETGFLGYTKVVRHFLVSRSVRSSSIRYMFKLYCPRVGSSTVASLSMWDFCLVVLMLRRYGLREMGTCDGFTTLRGYV